MKKFLFILFTTLFLCNFNLIAQDSTGVAEEKMINDSLFSNEINFSILGGVGLIMDGSVFGLSFDTTPIFYLGLEYPLTQTKYWTFQLKSHYWQATSTKEYSDRTYYKISDNKYAQLALAGIIKWFYLNIGDFRSSFQLGYYTPLINLGTYTGLDLGMGVDYKVNGNYTISLLLNVADYKCEHISGTWTLFYHLYTAVSINLFYKINLGI